MPKAGPEVARPFCRVVLTADVAEHGLRAADVGIIVESYEGREGVHPGFDVEFSSATGDTVAVVTLAETSVSEATPHVGGSHAARSAERRLR